MRRYRVSAGVNVDIVPIYTGDTRTHVRTRVCLKKKKKVRGLYGSPFYPHANHIAFYLGNIDPEPTRSTVPENENGRLVHPGR